MCRWRTVLRSQFDLWRYLCIILRKRKIRSSCLKWSFIWRFNHLLCIFHFIVFIIFIWWFRILLLFQNILQTQKYRCWRLLLLNLLCIARIFIYYIIYIAIIDILRLLEHCVGKFRLWMTFLNLFNFWSFHCWLIEIEF